MIGDHVLVAETCAAEDIEGRTDSDIYAPAAAGPDLFKVGHGGNATGVGGGNGNRSGQQIKQAGIDTHALAFNIDGMNQEFVTAGGQLIQHRWTDPQFGEPLPAISHHIVTVVSPATAEIQHESIPTNQAGEAIQPLPIKLAVVENMGSDDEMGSALIKPEDGVGGGDAATNLHAARPGGKSLASRLFVSTTEHDDVAAAEIVPTVQSGVMGWGKVRGEIGVQGGLTVGEG